MGHLSIWIVALKTLGHFREEQVNEIRKCSYLLGRSRKLKQKLKIQKVIMCTF